MTTGEVCETAGANSPPPRLPLLAVCRRWRGRRWVGCGTGGAGPVATGGIPEEPFAVAATLPPGVPTPTAVNALNALGNGSSSPAGLFGDAPAPALPAPAVTPDVVVRAVGDAVVMPDEEGSSVAEPELTPDVSGRCWADQRRVMEWEPAITGATLDRVCALATIAPQDYELVESFAECAGEHRLLWDMSDAGDAYGGESGAPLTGTDPRDYRTRMLLGLDDVDREGKRGFVEAVCAPGPDAELQQFAADWTRCLEADGPLLPGVSGAELRGRVAAVGRDHGAEPEQLRSVVYQGYDALSPVFADQMVRCQQAGS